MKIWKAILEQKYSNKKGWYTEFKFVAQEEDFKEHANNRCWVSRKWLHTTKVNKEMYIGNNGSYGNISIVQGFDRELGEEELKDTQRQMLRALRKQLCLELNNIQNLYSDRIESIDDERGILVDGKQNKSR